MDFAILEMLKIVERNFDWLLLQLFHPRYYLLKKNYFYGKLSRLSTTEGLYTRFSLVVPAKVKACKSYVATQKFPLVENKEHSFDLIFFAFEQALIWVVWVFTTAFVVCCCKLNNTRICDERKI